MSPTISWTFLIDVFKGVWFGRSVGRWLGGGCVGDGRYLLTDSLVGIMSVFAVFRSYDKLLGPQSPVLST